MFCPGDGAWWRAPLCPGSPKSAFQPAAISRPPGKAAARSSLLRERKRKERKKGPGRLIYTVAKTLLVDYLVKVVLASWLNIAWVHLGLPRTGCTERRRKEGCVSKVWEPFASPDSLCQRNISRVFHRLFLAPLSPGTLSVKLLLKIQIVECRQAGYYNLSDTSSHVQLNSCLANSCTLLSVMLSLINRR